MNLEIKEIKNNKIKIGNQELSIDEISNYKEIENNPDKDIIIKTCSYQNYNNNISLIRNIFLEENLKKYKPEELTDDFLPTVETLLKEMDIKDLEQNEKNEKNKTKIYNREMIMRVKCLSLLKIGKDIMTNTLYLNMNDRKKLQEIMWSYNDIPHEDIIKEFNDKANGEIFDKDISKLPIYDYN